MKYIFFITLFFITRPAVSQNADKPFIKLVEPLKEKNNVTSSRNFLVGSTCKTCAMVMNGQPVHVYPTGAFAIEVNLTPGDTVFNLAAGKSEINRIAKSISYHYELPAAPDTVKTLSIASIQTFPEGNLMLQPGDKIKFRIKALTRCTVVVGKNIPLYEMAFAMPGIYQGEYMHETNR
jgi:N-acetylmuramoyl-L-alanine amidase